MSRVYLGNLSNRASSRDVERFFKGFGHIQDVMLKTGFAFVEFSDHRDADEAVYEMNGRELCGERVLVQHARGTPHGGDYERDRARGYIPTRPSRDGRQDRDSRYGPPVRTQHRLVVENLSTRVSWQDLKDCMRVAGEVTYADAHNGRTREGVVEFAHRSDMKRALEKLDGKEMFGRKIKLIEDKGTSRKRSRSRSGSGSRRRSKRSMSGSRDPSHSKSRSRSRKRSRCKDRSGSRDGRRVKKEDDNRSPTRSASNKSVSPPRSKGRSRSPDKRSSTASGEDDR